MGGDPPLDDSDFLETRSRFLASCRSGSVVSPLDVSPSLLGEESLQGFRDEESRLLEFLVQWQAQFMEQLHLQLRLIQDATNDVRDDIRVQREMFEQWCESHLRDVHKTFGEQNVSVDLFPAGGLGAGVGLDKSQCDVSQSTDSIPRHTLSFDEVTKRVGENGNLVLNRSSSVLSAFGISSHDSKSSVGFITSVLVVLNTIFIGFEVESNLQQAKKHEPSLESLMWVDLGFTVAFVLEFFLRAAVYRCELFTGEDRYWNVFEIALTITSLLEWIVQTIDLTFMRSLRVLRAVRAVRVFRILRFVRELRLMVASVICSLPSLMWACIFLFFVLFLFSMFIISDVSNHIQSQGTVDSALNDFYGSLGGSMVSLFMAITGGHDWRDILKPLQEINYYFYTLFFLFYVSFTVFGVMNVLTAIFVESASRISEIDRDLVIQEQISATSSSVDALKKVFRDADVDNTNLLNKQQFETHLRDSDVRAYLRFLELDVFEARGLFQMLDTQEKGVVDIDDFVVGMMRLKGAARGYDLAWLMQDMTKNSVRLDAFMKFVEDQFKELVKDEVGRLEHREVQKKSLQDYIRHFEITSKTPQKRLSHLGVQAAHGPRSSISTVKNALKRLGTSRLIRDSGTSASQSGWASFTSSVPTDWHSESSVSSFAM